MQKKENHWYLENCLLVSIWKKMGKERKALFFLAKMIRAELILPLVFVTSCLWFRLVYSHYMKYYTGNRPSPPPLFLLLSFLTWQMPFPDVCLPYLAHNVLWRTWIKPKSSSVCFRNVRQTVSHRRCLLASFYFQYTFLCIFIVFVKVSAIYLVH